MTDVIWVAGSRGGLGSTTADGEKSGKRPTSGWLRKSPSVMERRPQFCNSSNKSPNMLTRFSNVHHVCENTSLAQIPDDSKACRTVSTNFNLNSEDCSLKKGPRFRAKVKSCDRCSLATLTTLSLSASLANCCCIVPSCRTSLLAGHVTF